MSVITFNIANSFPVEQSTCQNNTLLFLPNASSLSALDKLQQGWQALLGAYLETSILKTACFRLWGVLLWKRARRLWEE